MSNKAAFFHCEYCNIDCRSKRVFTSHIQSYTHIQNVNVDNTDIASNIQFGKDEIKDTSHKGVFVCEYCNTEYKYKKNYTRHLQTCEKKDTIIAVKKEYEIPNV